MPKNLFCVPLIQAGIPSDLSENYWSEVEDQINMLERVFGKIKKIYHEANDLDDQPGLEVIRTVNEKSFELTKKLMERGGKLQGVEDKELFLEIIDCQLLLSIGFMSKSVSEKISRIRLEILEIYENAVKKRREHISKKISESLQEGEAGVLFMRDEERMQIQFPPEINVVLVRPPALNDIERWRRKQSEVK